MSTTSRATGSEGGPPQDQRRSGDGLYWPAGVDAGAARADARVALVLVGGPERSLSSSNSSCAKLARASFRSGKSMASPRCGSA